MNTFEIELSPRAFQDLERVKREVFEASQSDLITSNYLRRIATEIDKLSSMPARFPLWKSSRKHRFLITEKYLVFFRIEDDLVKIDHVRYAGRRPFQG